jgi:hypothetical protein
MYISNYEQAYEYLTRDIIDLQDGATGEDCMRTKIQWAGEDIYKFLCTDAKQSYKNGFKVYYMDVTMILINKERFNPINFGIDYHADGYDVAGCFYFNGSKWSFSLYNDNGKFDCSAICKTFGGGGHKGAAGFMLDDINDILKSYKANN